MERKKINIIINGKKYLADENQTILAISRENKIDIPHLCFHPDLENKANCRLCLVEIKGIKTLQTACSTIVEEGMEILTESPKINRLRKFNLELIFAQHVEECDDCVYKYNCQLLKLAARYNVKIARFPDRKIKRPIEQVGPMVFDQTKCIDCRNCVEVCPVQYLEIKDQGAEIEVRPCQKKNKDCIYCGQCLVYCPVGAIESAGEFESISKPLKQKNKILVAQFAPAIRSSIGEEFCLEPGTVVTGQLIAGLKKLGFNRVFDTSVGADFTTFEEAQELIERLQSGKNLPAFSSCCPSWVKFLEFYHPELISHLCTSRSPQVILGGLIKTWWAKKEKIDPKKIIVVSIMPCVAKKFEIKRKELKINGLYPIDYVLTTRELAFLFKENKIDLKKIKPEKADSPFGDPSGAGVIYGASGGVFESALRTAYFKMSGKNLEDVNFKEVRGTQGLKKGLIKLGDKNIKVRIVSGIENAIECLKELKDDPLAFQAMEVMACPGGCIGGGGQPLPTNSWLRKKRAEALYVVDQSKKIRSAHENPDLQRIYQEYLTNEKIIHQVCHTRYSPKKKSKIYKLKNSRQTYE